MSYSICNCLTARGPGWKISAWASRGGVDDAKRSALAGAGAGHTAAALFLTVIASGVVSQPGDRQRPAKIDHHQLSALDPPNDQEKVKPMLVPNG